MRPTGITIGDHIELLAVGKMAPLPDPLYALSRMKTSDLKARYCQAMAGYYRTMWERGKQETIQSLLSPWASKSMAVRFGNIAPELRRDYAIIMWYKSQKARDLLDAEEQWQRRAVAFGVAPQGGVGHATPARTATIPNPRQNVL